MTRYAVDLDGTLADTVGAVLKLFNESHGSSIQHSDINRWDFWNSEAFDPWIGHLREQVRREIVLDLMNEAWNSGIVKADHEANYMMHELQRYGSVDVVTGRGQGTPDAVIKSWLAQNGITYDRLVRVHGSKSKVFYGYDTYVDDDPNLADEIAANWPEKRVILRDQPWNRRTMISPRVRRVTNLFDAIPTGAAQQARLFRRAGRDVRVRQHERRSR